MSIEDRLSNDEYEKQYFGFSSTEISEDFKSLVKTSIEEALTELETILCAGDNSTLNIKGIKKIYALYLVSQKNCTDRFETEVRKNFKIPENVVLMEEMEENNLLNTELNKIQEDITQLQNDLIKEKVFIAKCEQMNNIYENEINLIYDEMNHIMTAFSNYEEMLSHTNYDLKLKLARKKIDHMFVKTKKAKSHIGMFLKKNPSCLQSS